MPHVPDITTHAAHDPELIAAYAAGDATGPELDAALTLVAGCAECAALHHDLRLIAAALPGLPAPVRPRDFRLSAEQAAALRPRGWRALAATFAGPGFGFAAPLGTALATLGLVGLLVSGPGLPFLASGGTTAGTVEYAAGSAASAGPGPMLLPGEAPAASPALSAAPSAAPSSDLAGGGAVNADGQPTAGPQTLTGTVTPAPASPQASDGSTTGAATQRVGSGPVTPIRSLPTGSADGTDAGTGAAGAVSMTSVAAGALVLAGLLLVGLRLLARRAA
jgi:hypothetical protein